MKCKLPYDLRFTLVAAASVLLLAGCSNPNNDEMTSAVVSGEKAVAMEGSGTYFSGDLTVKVTMGRGVGHGLKKSGRAKGDYTYEDYARNENKSLLGSPLPPVTIRIILSNHSDHPMTVSITNFNSDMGNFVVDPETITVAAGQEAEPTSMVSDLGVSSDTIPFQVEIHYGAAKEAKVIQVRSLATAPPGP